MQQVSWRYWISKSFYRQREEEGKSDTEEDEDEEENSGSEDLSSIDGDDDKIQGKFFLI